MERDDTPNDSWASWSRHVLAELEHQNTDIETLFSMHNEKIKAINDLNKEIATIQGKLTILIILLGTGLTIGSALIIQFFMHLIK